MKPNPTAHFVRFVHVIVLMGITNTLGVLKLWGNLQGLCPLKGNYIDFPCAFQTALCLAFHYISSFFSYYISFLTYH